MKKIFFSFLLALCMASSFAQTSDKTISFKNDFFGMKFYQSNQKLGMAEVASIMQTNADAFAHIRSARSNNTWSSVFGAIGGAMLGYPLGTAIGGGDPNWTIAGVGAGLIVVSIPFAVKAKNEAVKAVHAYNEGLAKTSLRKSEFKLYFSGSGMLLCYRF